MTTPPSRHASASASGRSPDRIRIRCETTSGAAVRLADRLMDGVPIGRIEPLSQGLAGVLVQHDDRQDRGEDQEQVDLARPVVVVALEGGEHPGPMGRLIEPELTAVPRRGDGLPPAAGMAPQEPPEPGTAPDERREL